MNLKNNLKNYFPLKVAISSVFGFFIIYILFGLDGWGDRASNENAIGEVSRWCERVSDGLLREPSNTLGNLGFVITGLYMFYKLSDDATNNKTPITIISIDKIINTFISFPLFHIAPQQT